MKDYSKLIQSKVDKGFNLILEVSSIIALIASVFLFFADLPKSYFFLNFIVGILLMAFFLLGHRIDISKKILVVILVTVIIGVASFLGGSFTSAYLSVFMVANIIAVLFLAPKQSIIVSILSIIIMLFLAFYSSFIGIDPYVTTPFFTWGLQIIAYALVLLVLNISSYLIKGYLIETIKKLEKSVEASNQLAYYDQLTGLPNYHKFILEANEVIERRQQDGFLLLFNLKSLRLINSTLGTDAGDQTLIEISKLFKELKADNSVIARVSGNEFIIWHDAISEEALNERFAYVVNKMKIESKIFKNQLEFYASYVPFKCGVDDLESCFQKALVTLTYVKTENIVVLTSYAGKLEEAVRRKEAIKNRIAMGLVNEEFKLFYQAKYDLRTNKVVGVEALARWENKELGFVSPGEFIPIIESLNMSVEFGEFVMDYSFRDFKKLQEKYGEDVGLSINISPSHIIDSTIVQKLCQAMDKYNIPPNQITIEITEEIIIKSIESVRPILNQLRDLKVKISLDDFGTGYSSLNYLTQLNLDEIKIDKSFTDQIDSNHRIKILLESIVHIARQFELTIIAEGVETKSQNDLFGGLGCYIIQGYYYAKPEAL